MRVSESPAPLVRVVRTAREAILFPYYPGQHSASPWVNMTLGYGERVPALELNWQPLPSDYEMSTLAIGGRRAAVIKLFAMLALTWALFSVVLVLTRTTTVIAVTGAFVVAVVICVLVLRVGPTLTSKFFLKRNPDMLAPAIARIDDRGISIWQAERVMRCAWPELRQWTETTDVFYCQIDRDQDRAFMVLPKRATADAEQLDALRDALRVHAPQR